MATATRTGATPAELDQLVELRGVDWKGYSTLIRLRGEHSVPRIVYLDGNVFLMSPSFPHERLAERLGIFVLEVVVGLDIPCIPAGHTTFRRKKKRGGVEGDKTFYLANMERVRGKDKIHLRFDPPPDLAVEAVHSHGADAAVEVWRRFGVPEVWVCDESELTILALDDRGRYVKGESVAFPFLSAAEVHNWVARPQTESETVWIKDLRSWVRRVVLPRYQGGRGEVRENP